MISIILVCHKVLCSGSTHICITENSVSLWMGKALIYLYWIVEYPRALPWAHYSLLYLLITYHPSLNTAKSNFMLMIWSYIRLNPISPKSKPHFSQISTYFKIGFHKTNYWWISPSHIQCYLVPDTNLNLCPDHVRYHALMAHFWKAWTALNI